jgi:hypothetical protein
LAAPEAGALPKSQSPFRDSSWRVMLILFSASEEEKIKMRGCFDRELAVKPSDRTVAPSAASGASVS